MKCLTNQQESDNDMSCTLMMCNQFINMLCLHKLSHSQFYTFYQYMCLNLCHYIRMYVKTQPKYLFERDSERRWEIYYLLTEIWEKGTFNMLLMNNVYNNKLNLFSNTNSFLLFSQQSVTMFIFELSLILDTHCDTYPISVSTYLYHYN